MIPIIIGVEPLTIQNYINEDKRDANHAFEWDGMAFPWHQLIRKGRAESRRWRIACGPPTFLSLT